MRADRGAERDLIRLLSTGRPRAQLAAAEALGRCGGPETLSAAWRGLAAGPDRFLNHALVHAVHRLADARSLQAALARPEPAVQAAALLLLDQPPRPQGSLGPGPVMSRMGSPDTALRDASLRVLTRHPEWSGEALDHIRHRLRSADHSEPADMVKLVLAFQDRPDVQELLAGVAMDAKAPDNRRVWALSAITRSKLSPLPACWISALAGSIRDTRPSVRSAAVHAAAVLQVPLLDAALLALADDPAEPSELRLEALRAALHGTGSPHQPPSSS